MEASALTDLIRLQEILNEISALRGRVDQAPREVEQLEQSLAEERNHVEMVEQKIQEAGTGRKRLEHEVAELRLKLSHYKDQLMLVKTNTEYQAMLHEIDFVEQKIVGKEDAILEDMMAAEELDRELAAAQQRFASQQKQIDAEKQSLQSFIEESQVRLEELEAQREETESGIPQDLRERYTRIASARGGVALAQIENHSCSACHVRLRPQLVAEVRANKGILLCENCSRILYYSYQ